LSDRKAFQASTKAPCGRRLPTGWPETFDSALLLGNNLGVLGSRENAASFLSDLGRLLTPGGVIVGTMLDVY
jgi:hypothetical protein